MMVEPLHAPPLRRLRVLLVDDSIPVRQRLCSLIEEDTRIDVVAQAGTVAQALACVERDQPDAVVLDLQLPDGSGYTVLQAIRQAGQPCLVIVLTNHFDPENRKRCLLLGADRFLDKWGQFDFLPGILGQRCDDLQPDAPARKSDDTA